MGQGPTQEYQKTDTIRNQVNLKKQSLKLAPVEGRPTDMHLTFTFDASAACRCALPCIFIGMFAIGGAHVIYMFACMLLASFAAY